MISSPYTEQFIVFAQCVEDGSVTLTDDLRAAIATLNAACARAHFGKDPRPTKPESRTA